MLAYIIVNHTDEWPMLSRLASDSMALWSTCTLPRNCTSQLCCDISVIRDFPMVSQLATGRVTCHACHGCVKDFRPILGNPVEVTHVTSPGHVYIFPR